MHVDGASNVVVRGPRTVMVVPACSLGLGVVEDGRLQQRGQGMAEHLQSCHDGNIRKEGLMEAMGGCTPKSHPANRQPQ